MSSKKEKKPDAKCPGELDEILKLVNLLPKNVLSVYENLKEKYESEEQYLNEQTQINPNDIDIKMDLTFLFDSYGKKIEQLLPKDVYYYVVGIFDTGFKEFTFYNGITAQIEPLEKLFELITLKQLLKQIAVLTSLEFEVIHPASRLTFQPLISFGLDVEGNVKSYASPIVEVFSRNNIPLERIRLCPICEDIFWALKVSQDNVEREYKSNSNACSPSCVNTYRQRKFQSKKRIKKYEKQLAEETAKLEKLQLKNSMPDNNLISEQKATIKKLEKLIEEDKRIIENHLETQRRNHFEKINREKIKNGNL